MNVNRALASARRFLLDHQQSDGGWSYGSGTYCYPEPTCYALLALSPGDAVAASGDPSPGPLERGLGWLTGRQNVEGALTLRGDDTPDWGTALGLFTRIRLGEPEETWRNTARWLLDWKAITAERSPDLVLDPRIPGWPWFPDSFSWVIPTAHAVLALKLAGYGSHARVLDGEKLLLDRVCQGGGWNYGNREVFGQILEPMADTTAWALFALQGAVDATEAVDLGLAYLDHQVPRRPSALSLALSLLCFDLYQRPIDDLLSMLLERQRSDGSWQQQTHLTALAVLAIRLAEGERNAFQL